MPKLFDLAFFPAAKGADKFHLLRLDQLASLLNVNHKDSMFLDDRGEERPYQDLDKYIFYSYERISCIVILAGSRGSFNAGASVWITSSSPRAGRTPPRTPP